MIENRRPAPGSEAWRMFRRALGCGERKYDPSYTPGSRTVEEAAWHGCLPWTMVQGAKLGKGTAVPAQYELPERLG